jgi:hypothetical protein
MRSDSLKQLGAFLVLTIFIHLIGGNKGTFLILLFRITQ